MRLWRLTAVDASEHRDRVWTLRRDVGAEGCAQTGATVMLVLAVVIVPLLLGWYIGSDVKRS